MTEIQDLKELVKELHTKVDKILINELPHLKGDITVLMGKVKNLEVWFGKMDDRQGQSWPRFISVSLAILSSLFVSLLTYILTKGLK